MRRFSGTAATPRTMTTTAFCANRLGKDIVYVQASVPSADSFPSLSALGELHDVLVKRESIEDEVRRGDLLPLKANTPDVLEATRNLLVLTDEMIGLLAELEEFGDGWPLELRAKCRQASFSSERAARESLFDDLDALIDARAEFLKSPIVIPEAGLTNPRTVEAIARAVESGKPFGFVSISASDAKEYIAAIRIEGRSPATPDDWTKVQRWLGLHLQVLTFNTRWNELHQLLSVPSLNGGVSGLRQLEVVATTARKPSPWRLTLMSIVRRAYVARILGDPDFIDASEASPERPIR